MCACHASKYCNSVVVFEKNKQNVMLSEDKFFDNAYLGKKLLITGKGRCNLTNDCTLQEFLQKVPVNSKFLYSALRSYSPRDVMDFFENNGCALKVERGNRVFPVSDKSRDILQGFKKYLLKTEAIFKNLQVTSIEKNGNYFNVFCGREKFIFRKVIICTGGLSYPLTGSTGDGYEFARLLGHSVTELTGSLVPLTLCGNFHKKAMGLSLRNVVLSLFDSRNRKVFSELGELTFAHFGITGPLVLSASSHIRGTASNYRIEIDMKPSLDEKMLENRVLSDFSKHQNRNIVNGLYELLPSKIIEPFIEVCGITNDIKVNSIKKEQRREIIKNLKHLSFDIYDKNPVSEAVITSGGVSVSQINPSTMESKICEGLYFAGEIIDVDAYTGGFNLQIAFSTGKLAGESAGLSLQ